MTEQTAGALKQPNAELVDIETLTLHPDNPRHGDIDSIVDSIRANGFIGALRVQTSTRRVIGGNHSLQAAQRLGYKQVPVIWADVDDDTALRYLIADNRTNDLATNDDAGIAAILERLAELPEGLAGTGYDDAALDELLASISVMPIGAPAPSLADRFLVPPFSILDARQGYWQDRKRQWLNLGIRGEAGRPQNLLKFSKTVLEAQRSAKPNKSSPSDTGNDPAFYTKKTKAERKLGRELSTAEFLADYYEGSDVYTEGTSVFDPVLCEVAYRWFSAAGANVLDPFAGGSVRGIVAGLCERSYHGIDLRPEQVQENQQQVAEIVRAPAEPEPLSNDPSALTPVEQHGGHLVKRDDRFGIAQSAGGKVRSCLALASQPGVKGLVTAGSRHSPQVNIVATVGKTLGLPVRAHVPSGAMTPELLAAQAEGAEIVQHKAGYNTVIIKRAKDDATERGWLEIPFGMETPVAIEETGGQVANLPFGSFDRLVVPVGSGMSLAGILHGLQQAGQHPPILGVIVGADPTQRLDRYAPPGWRDQVELVNSGLDYDDYAPTTALGDLPLDPVYEAKCLPFLQPGDLLWVVGIRETARPGAAGAVTYSVGDSLDVLPGFEDESFDLIFTCPPYYDLERYSDDPADLSTMEPDKFDATYRAILVEALRCLRPNRFAVLVVGNVRDERGIVRDLRALTVEAMAAGGAEFVQDAVLVTAIGSLALRSARAFEASRALGRSHQEVVVFCKGDRFKATQACGPVSYSSSLDPMGVE